MITESNQTVEDLPIQILKYLCSFWSKINSDVFFDKQKILSIVWLFWGNV
jgi:hypothetical protein